MIKMEYETLRLRLVLSRPELLCQVVDYYARNRQFLADTDAQRPDAFFTEEYQKRELEFDLQQLKAMTGIRFWLQKKQPEDNRIIGEINFNVIIMGVFQSSFLSYSLDKDEINQGLMTEAVGKAVEIAFGDIGLHRLEANIMPRNVASLKVAVKNRFIYEGISRRYLKINGIWEDHVHMVRLNE